MATWKREPEETPGSHRFDSHPYNTPGIRQTLTQAEQLELMRMLEAAVKEHDGLDYLQVFSCDDGRRVWVIDDGSHFTWLLPSEY